MAKVATTGFTISDVPYGEKVVAGDLVGWSGGKLVKACGSSTGLVPAVGVAAATYKEGDMGAMHLTCVIAGLSSLSAGAPQYLSLAAPGSIQSSAPSGGGNLKQVVGYAVASDRIAVVLQDAGVAL